MTVRELINLLEDYNEDAEVRIAHQPSWPFEYSIGNVVGCEGADHEDEDAEPNDDDALVVYIGEGDQLGYLPGSVCCELGWK